MEIIKIKYSSMDGMCNVYYANEVVKNCSVESDDVQQWIAEGNTPEPEFTEAELAQQVINAKVQEARAYLISTGWYIERLNDPSSGKAIPQEVLDKRAEARVIINELEG